MTRKSGRACPDSCSEVDIGFCQRLNGLASRDLGKLRGETSGKHEGARRFSGNFEVVEYLRSFDVSEMLGYAPRNMISRFHSVVTSSSSPFLEGSTSKYSIRNAATNNEFQAGDTKSDFWCHCLT